MNISTNKEVNNPICIYCNGTVQKSGKTKYGEQRFICFDCGKTFFDGKFSKEINIKVKKKERDELIKKMYVEDKLSTTKIGEILNLSNVIIGKILNKFGVIRTISDAKVGVKLGTKLPEQNIITDYLNGESSIKITKKYNISKRSVLNVLVANNINRDNKYEYLNEYINEMRELYLSGKSMNEISNILDVSYSTINSNLHKLGIVRTENRFGLGIDYNEWLKTLTVYEKYRCDVRKITNKQPIEQLENFNKRGLSGINGAYQLDHKFSILEGFKQGISPEIIGNINNLEFIPWEENNIKKDKCSITESELLKLIRVK